MKLINDYNINNMIEMLRVEIAFKTWHCFVSSLNVIVLSAFFFKAKVVSWTGISLAYFIMISISCTIIFNSFVSRCDLNKFFYFHWQFLFFHLKVSFVYFFFV